jgi:tyrosyl-tRNA synthetase
MSEVVLSGSNRLSQALVEAGLSSSRTEADRLVKAGAVEINGERCTNPGLALSTGTHTVRAGKKWKRITVQA